MASYGSLATACTASAPLTTVSTRYPALDSIAIATFWLIKLSSARSSRPTLGPPLGEGDCPATPERAVSATFNLNATRRHAWRSFRSAGLSNDGQIPDCAAVPGSRPSSESVKITTRAVMTGSATMAFFNSSQSIPGID